MWWLAMIWGDTHTRSWGGWQGGHQPPGLQQEAEGWEEGGGRATAPGTALTWRVVGIMRFRPSTEMLTAMLMPAKRRLLLPRMEKRALLGA